MRGSQRHCANTFDDEIGESKLIECSWSSDCSLGSCYRSDNSLSKGNKSKFRAENDPIFVESCGKINVKFQLKLFHVILFFIVSCLLFEVFTLSPYCRHMMACVLMSFFVPTRIANNRYMSSL